jgi:hypothetical protein
MTFRFIDLVAQPYITYSRTDYPRHRTSLWSQVYGGAHLAHFDGHPPSWVSRRASVRYASRAILFLALIPTALLLVGIAQRTVRAARGIIDRERHVDVCSVMMTVACFAFAIFLTAYAYRYRAFSVMKPIFIYPALLAFPYHFAVGFDWIGARCRRRSGIALLFQTLLTGLIVLYVFEVASLIAQLW